MSEVTRKRDFHHLQNYCTAFILRCSDWSKTWRNMHTTKLIQRSLKQISNGELSDPLCDNVNRDLTLVILITNSFKKHIASTVTHGWVFQLHVCKYNGPQYMESWFSERGCCHYRTMNAAATGVVDKEDVNPMKLVNTVVM